MTIVKTLPAAGILFALTVSIARAQISATKPLMDSMLTAHGIIAECSDARAFIQDKKGLQRSTIDFEFRDGAGAYGGDVAMMVLDQDDHEVANIQCEGPRITLNLTPGHYTARANIQGAPVVSTAFDVGANSQKTISFRF